MVTMLAAGGGQLMLGLSMEIKTTLFIVISILASLSLVPVTMSRRSEAPMTIDYQRVSLATLWRQSPVGVYGRGDLRLGLFGFSGDDPAVRAG